MIRVLYKRPGNRAEIRRVENDIRDFEALMHGSVRSVGLDDMVVFYREESGLYEMKYNCEFRGVKFYGPIVICEEAEDGLKDIEYTKALVIQMGLMRCV